MARLNIKYDIIKNLGDKLDNGIGTSKHKDKLETQSERSIKGKELKEQGLSGKDYLRELDNINKMEDKIYMDKTFQDYKRICSKFAEYVIEQHGNRRISLEDSRQYIQPYINKLIEEGKSPSYQKKILAGICKGTNAKMRDYIHEEVNYAKQTQRKHEQGSIHKEYNEKRHKDILDLNRCIGIRRNELLNLKTKDVKFYEDRCEVFCKSAKGGKDNYNIIRDTKKIEVIKLYYDKAISENRDNFITKDMLNNDADLHRSRAENARQEYYRIVEDMKNNDNRDYYKQLIKDELERKEKKYNLDKLDTPYKCRGENKEILESLNIPTEWDRVGVMYVSLFCLNHYREDTTVQHYLTKE